MSLYTNQLVTSDLWTPANLLTGLSAWYDAADPASIVQSGGSVSQWTDKSGNENHLKQGTADAQPTYGVGSEFPGRLVVTTTTSNFMSTDGNITVNNANTIFMVFSQTNNARAYFISYTVDAAYIGTWLNNYVFRFIHDGATFTHPTPGTPAIFTAVDAVGDYEMFFDGTSAYTSAVEPNLYDGDTNRLTLNSRSASTAQFAAEAEYAEIIIINSTLSTADRQLLEGYLAHKWGLTANLVGGHPYKTNPPY